MAGAAGAPEAAAAPAPAQLAPAVTGALATPSASLARLAVLVPHVPPFAAEAISCAIRRAGAAGGSQDGSEQQSVHPGVRLPARSLRCLALLLDAGAGLTPAQAAHGAGALAACRVDTVRPTQPLEPMPAR